MTELVPYTPGCLCISLEVLACSLAVFVFMIVSITKFLCCKRHNPSNEICKVESKDEKDFSSIVGLVRQDPLSPIDLPDSKTNKHLEHTITRSTSPIVLPNFPYSEECEEFCTEKIKTTSTSEKNEENTYNVNTSKNNNDEEVKNFIIQSKEEENVSDSVEMITVAISLLPIEPKLYETRCHFLCQMGQYEAALKDAYTVIELSSSSESRALAGEVLLQMRKLEESLFQFTQGANLNPNCQKCKDGLNKIRSMEVMELVQRGDDEFEKRQYENAAIIYTQAISLMPSIELYEKRAITLEKQGLYKQAQADWSRSDEYRRGMMGKKRLPEELERPSKYPRN